MKQKSFLFARLCLVLSLGLLTACAGQKTPASSGYYKIGQPYQIKGAWYYPQEDYSYDETGIASWYGDAFHRKQTANGEVFNKNELTAAHRTLPMPSLARVTNLDNGRAIVVRINDRGPYARGRIIDVSQRASQLLGFEKQGTAKVRVQVLADESKAIAEAMRRYGTEPKMAAYQQPAAQPAPPQAQPQQAVEAQPLPTLATVKPVPEYVQVPVTNTGSIYVQAGAFTRPDNATRLKDKLSRLGSVNIAQAVVKGTQYYRVRIGPVATVAEADALLTRVLRSGADAARIIVD